MTRIQHKSQVPDSRAGERLDRVAADLFPDYSRGRIQTWIVAGELLVDGGKGVNKQKLKGGEWLVLDALLEDETDALAESMSLDVVFEDNDILVLNKPAGLVVHPGAGNRDGTLLNGLMHYHPPLSELPRGGIVHRLDKDTSGLMVVAKSLPAHGSLVAQLAQHTVSRRYDALVFGDVVSGGTVDAPIGRHPRDRKRMAVKAGGKRAVSHYRVSERFPGLTLLAVRLETGRTHQIRVHLSHVGHPLLGDPVYGGRSRIPAGLTDDQAAAVRDFGRQALHAARLEFTHPVTQNTVRFKASRPDDFESILQVLHNG